MAQALQTQLKDTNFYLTVNNNFTGKSLQPPKLRLRQVTEFSPYGPLFRVTVNANRSRLKSVVSKLSTCSRSRCGQPLVGWGFSCDFDRRFRGWGHVASLRLWSAAASCRFHACRGLKSPATADESPPSRTERTGFRGRAPVLWSATTPVVAWRRGAAVETLRNLSPPEGGSYKRQVASHRGTGSTVALRKPCDPRGSGAS